MNKMKKNQPQTKPMVNMLEGEPSTFRLVTYVPSINFTYKIIDWWLDSDTNIHVCTDKAYFFSYQDSSGESIIMKNKTSVNILGRQNVILRFTSKKSIILRGI